MAFSFSKRYNTERLFDINTDDFEYISLEELYNQSGGDENLAYEIRGVYINTKGHYDDAPVLAINGWYVNLPAHLTSQCKEMLNDRECIKAINEGKCGFTIYKYHKKRYDRDCYSVQWIDI